MLLKMTIELESDIVMGLIADSMESGFNTVEDFAAHLIEGYVLDIDYENPDFSECEGGVCKTPLPILPEDETENYFVAPWTALLPTLDIEGSPN